MKTETQIAKENIKLHRNATLKFLPTDKIWFGKCKSHKESCQRFLKFLDNYNFNELIVGKKNTKILDSIQGKVFKEKIQDLKQAIKLYKEAGI